MVGIRGAPVKLTSSCHTCIGDGGWEMSRVGADHLHPRCWWQGFPRSCPAQLPALDRCCMLPLVGVGSMYKSARCVAQRWMYGGTCGSALPHPAYSACEPLPSSSASLLSLRTSSIIMKLLRALIAVATCHAKQGVASVAANVVL